MYFTAGLMDDSASDGYVSPSSTFAQNSEPPQLLLKRYRIKPDGSVEEIGTHSVYVSDLPRPLPLTTRGVFKRTVPVENRVSSTTTAGRGQLPAGPGHAVPIAAAGVAETVPDHLRSRNMLPVCWPGDLIRQTEVTVRSETIKILECRTSIGFFRPVAGQEH